MAKMCFRALGESYPGAGDGKIAIWEKPPTGDPMAPFNDPTNNISYVRFHSDLQYLSNSVVSTGISVSHTLLAGVTGTGLPVATVTGALPTLSGQITNGQVRTSDITLYTHSLGYAPFYFVIYNGEIVAGTTIIDQPISQLRMVSAFATTTQIKLREVAISSASDLPAVTRSYDVIVFKDPVADPAKPLLSIKAAELIFGYDKVNGTRKQLRRATIADSTFYVQASSTSDINNGAIRSVSLANGIKDLGTYRGSMFTTQAIPVTY